VKSTLAAIFFFVVGAAVCALFYPAKRIEEKELMIQALRAEKVRVEARASELEARTRETTVVIEHPDGTKRTKIVRERDVVRRAETRAVELEHRDEKIVTEKERVTETNPRRFSIEGGVRTDRAYFLRADGDVVGPLFVGVELDTRGVLGVGFGFRF
jgi:hypothetical protein